MQPARMHLLSANGVILIKQALTVEIVVAHRPFSFLILTAPKALIDTVVCMSFSCSVRAIALLASQSQPALHSPAALVQTRDQRTDNR